MTNHETTLGDCPCGSPIMSHMGVTVAPDGVRWHPECRVEAREAQQPDVPVVPASPRRGRPPKPRPE